MSRILIFLLVFFLLSSCKNNEKIKYNYEVSITDSLIHGYLNDYINYKIANIVDFEKNDVFILFYNYEFFQTRYILSYSSLDLVAKLPLDYYTYYNGHLILLYSSEWIQEINDLKYQKRLFINNNAWKELYIRENKRFSIENKMIFSTPDKLIITKCNNIDLVKIEYVPEILYYYLKNQFYGNHFCICNDSAKVEDILNRLEQDTIIAIIPDIDINE